MSKDILELLNKRTTKECKYCRGKIQTTIGAWIVIETCLKCGKESVKRKLT